MEQLCKEKLQYQKSTRKMHVYGNDVLAAQYIPKSLFSEIDQEDAPECVVLRISLPQDREIEDRKGRKSTKRAAE